VTDPRHAAGQPRPKVVAIRHIEFGDLGSLERTFTRLGFEVRCVDASSAEFAAMDRMQPDVVAIMGGPFGANDESSYPFIAEELDLIARRVAAGRATLGICLGAQLMARALGGRVYEGSGIELGWGEVSISDAGKSSCLAALGSTGTHVLHWHSDTFDLPPDATLLASTASYVNQAFRIDDTALGLQFHPEVSHTSMPRWLKHPRIATWLADLDRRHQRPTGYLPETLLAGGYEHGQRLDAQSAIVLETWLKKIEF
jgi:GMP synthase (glutamine-hydrolysing)